MGQNSSRLDGTIGTEYAKNCGRRSRGRDGSNPESSGGRGLQLSIHSTRSRVCARCFPSRTVRRCSTVGSRRSLCRGYRGTVSLSKTNPNGLPVRHADISPQTIENIILGTDSICLVNKIDESTFLKKQRNRIQYSVRNEQGVPSQAATSSSQSHRKVQIHELIARS